MNESADECAESPTRCRPDYALRRLVAPPKLPLPSLVVPVTDGSLSKFKGNGTLPKALLFTKKPETPLVLKALSTRLCDTYSPHQHINMRVCARGGVDCRAPRRSVLPHVVGGCAARVRHVQVEARLKRALEICAECGGEWDDDPVSGNQGGADAATSSWRNSTTNSFLAICPPAASP